MRVNGRDWRWRSSLLENRNNGIYLFIFKSSLTTADLGAAGLQYPENNQIQEVSTCWNSCYMLE